MIIYCSECGKVLGVIEKGGWKEIPAQMFVMCGDCVEPQEEWKRVEESSPEYLKFRVSKNGDWHF